MGMIAGAAIGSSLGWGWGHHHGKILKDVELKKTNIIYCQNKNRRMGLR